LRVHVSSPSCLVVESAHYAPALQGKRRMGASGGDAAGQCFGHPGKGGAGRFGLGRLVLLACGEAAPGGRAALPHPLPQAFFCMMEKYLCTAQKALDAKGEPPIICPALCNAA
jgi:hypothetical protein